MEHLGGEGDAAVEEGDLRPIRRFKAAFSELIQREKPFLPLGKCSARAAVTREPQVASAEEASPRLGEAGRSATGCCSSSKSLW